MRKPSLVFQVEQQRGQQVPVEQIFGPACESGGLGGPVPWGRTADHCSRATAGCMGLGLSESPEAATLSPYVGWPGTAGAKR